MQVRKRGKHVSYLWAFKNRNKIKKDQIHSLKMTSSQVTNFDK